MTQYGTPTLKLNGGTEAEATTNYPSGASGKFRLINDVYFIPKPSFEFHVQFISRNMRGATPSDLSRFGLLAKTCDIPGITMETKVMNQYNRKRIVYTNMQYDPVQIRLQDTSDQVIMKIWREYYKFYFGDSSTIDPGNIAYQGGTGGLGGLLGSFSDTTGSLSRTFGAISATVIGAREGVAGVLNTADDIKAAARSAASGSGGIGGVLGSVGSVGVALGTGLETIGGSGRYIEQAGNNLGGPLGGVISSIGQGLQWVGGLSGRATSNARARGGTKNLQSWSYDIVPQGGGDGGFEKSATQQGWGFQPAEGNPNSANYFFDRIEITEFYGGKYTQHAMINPKIKSINFGQRDVEITAGAEVTMTIEHEGIVTMAINKRMTADIARKFGVPFKPGAFGGMSTSEGGILGTLGAIADQTQGISEGLGTLSAGSAVLGNVVNGVSMVNQPTVAAGGQTALNSASSNSVASGNISTGFA